MTKKKFQISTIFIAFLLLFLLPLKTDAANYQFVQNGTKMQCINQSNKKPVSSKFIKYKGYTYYFDSKGYAHTGWLKYGNNYYFFNSNGAMVKNRWIGKYYLQANGKMATKKWISPTEYVGSNGKLISGYTKKAKAKFIKTKVGKKYQNYDGSYSKKTWQCINGNWYYFYSSGYMATNCKIGNYYVGKDGKMLINKNVRIKNYRYYYGPDGSYRKKTKIKTKNY